MNFCTLNDKLYNRLYLKKTPGMHFYCCNDAISWLNEAKSRIFQCTVIFKNFQIHLYFICHLPATCRKTWFHYVCRSNFSHKECNWCLQYEYLTTSLEYCINFGSDCGNNIYSSSEDNTPTEKRWSYAR